MYLHLFDYVSLCIFIFIYLSVFISICTSLQLPAHRILHLSFSPSPCVYIFPFLCLYICQFSISPSRCLSIHLSICQSFSVNISIHLSVSPFIYLYVSQSLCLCISLSLSLHQPMSPLHYLHISPSVCLSITPSPISLFLLLSVSLFVPYYTHSYTCKNVYKIYRCLRFSFCGFMLHFTFKSYLLLSAWSQYYKTFYGRNLRIFVIS
jgi:hypothetical protein